MIANELAAPYQAKAKTAGELTDIGVMCVGMKEFVLLSKDCCHPIVTHVRDPFPGPVYVHLDL